MTKKKEAAAAAIPETHRKSTGKANQKQMVYDSFFEDPKPCSRWSGTRMWCAPNICRYVGMMREDGDIRIVRKGHCPVSGWIAGFYTTNPRFMPDKDQLRIDFKGYDKKKE